jgi:hypothetical protein
VFDKRPSPRDLLNTANYSLVIGLNLVDLESARFDYDDDRTVTITLDAAGSASLATGASYDLAIYDLQSAQGVAMGGGAAESLVAAGDSLAPTLPLGKAQLDPASPLDTVLIEMSEALDPTDAVDPTLVLLNGVTLPDTLELLGFRTIRATFSGGVSTSDTIDVTLRDLAGNGGFATRAITSQDATGPLVTGVAGVSTVGLGGDLVTVVYDEPVDLVNGLNASSYAVTNGSSAMDLTDATLRWDSTSNPSQSLNVQVGGVVNLAGLTINPAANVFGSVSGDTTAPDFDAAFVDLRVDAGGTTVDVLFDEDVDESFASTASNWSTSGPSVVTAAQHVDGRWWRATLSTTLVVGESFAMNGLSDLAGNTSGAIAIVPTP